MFALRNSSQPLEKIPHETRKVPISWPIVDLQQHFCKLTLYWRSRIKTIFLDIPLLGCIRGITLYMLDVHFPYRFHGIHPSIAPRMVCQDSKLSKPQGLPYWTLQTTKLFQLSINHVGLFNLKVSYQNSITKFNYHHKILPGHRYPITSNITYYAEK